MYTYSSAGLVVMEIHETPAVLATAPLVAPFALANVHERLGEPATDI